jgi:triphosphoribosyl-dephospho-CoA synthetase
MEASLALAHLDSIIEAISQLTAWRWKNLREKFQKACRGFTRDEVILVMMDDEESKKYIVQRMREILEEEWAAEREGVIHQLTKQIGMLEMKWAMGERGEVERNRMNVIQDLVDTKEQEIRQLQQKLRLKENYIEQIEMDAGDRARESGYLEFKDKYEELLVQKNELKDYVTKLKIDINEKENVILRFEVNWMFICV